METKRCTKCGEAKSLSDFHKNKGKKDGLNYRCKICRANYAVVNRKNINRKVKQKNEKLRGFCYVNCNKNTNPIFLICKHCGYCKNIDLFKTDKREASNKIRVCLVCFNNKNRLLFNKQYKKNRLKSNKRTQGWRANNPEKITEYAAVKSKEMHNGYIASMFGIPLSEIPPELIEAKRAQLKLHRLAHK